MYTYSYKFTRVNKVFGAVGDSLLLLLQDRVQLITNMPVQVKKCLTVLNGSLSGKVYIHVLVYTL